MKKLSRLFCLILALAMLLASCTAGEAPAADNPEPAQPSETPAPADDYVDTTDYTVDLSIFEQGTIPARVSVHDPSVVRDGDAYYIFGSHMTAARSDDLRAWTWVANGYGKNNSVYSDFYNDEKPVFDWAGNKNSTIPTDDGGVHVWAPDVKYIKEMGKWVMYACTSSTFCGSNLCMLTSDTIDGTYEWQAGFIFSGVTADTIAETDIYDYVTEEYAAENYLTRKGEYNFDDWPNSIDPAVFYDEDDRLWMVYGSYSGGIFLLELDKTTGLPIHPEADPENGVDAYYGKRLIGGGHKSIEGPYIVYDAEAGYYYLFVSYGWLGRDGGYQMRVFRSDKPDGQYVDMAGNYPKKGLNHTYFGLKLSGNYSLPSVKVSYMATGHNSALIDADGKRYVVSHVRFDNGTESFSDRTKQYFLNEEGWPCLLPYQTNGETISKTGYDKAKLCGKYYVINQGMTVDGEVAEPFILNLAENGSVYSKDGKIGSWSVKDGSPYMRFTLPSDYGDVEYSGVFCRQPDEAGVDVTVFTAVGSNESVWGVKYDG